MKSTSFLTADLYDAHPDACQVCPTQFKQYGKRRTFAGPIRTVSCRDDNVLVRRALETPGKGEVLVVDGGNSLESALLGDIMAEMARKNGWAGIIIFGAVRDSVVLGKINLGVKALGTNPKKSGKFGTGTSNTELRCGDVTFKPGNWVYSDDDGLLVFQGKVD